MHKNIAKQHHRNQAYVSLTPLVHVHLWSKVTTIVRGHQNQWKTKHVTEHIHWPCPSHLNPILFLPSVFFAKGEIKFHQFAE